MRRLVSLNFVKPGDTRKPITVRIMVQDDGPGGLLTECIDLDEHQFAALISGSVVTAESFPGGAS